MKAGLAIDLSSLFSATRAVLNVLFLALPDEDNISAGMIQAVSLAKGVLTHSADIAPLSNA
jgi:arginine utilization protein RocB